MLQRIVCLFAMALVGIPMTALAQEESPAGEFGSRIEVSEVLLDVLVTDKKGDVILGLTPDDFVVKDEGSEIPLTGASFYSNRFLIRDDDTSRIKKPGADEVLADRYFVFFFHDQHQRTGGGNPLLRQQFDAARKTRQWIQEEMLPGDWVAVVSYDYKLKVHQDFTRSRENLLKAVKRATVGKDPSNVWRSRRPADLPEGQPTLLTRLPEGKELSKKTERIYDGIQVLADATRDILGRKHLILFSTGFGRIDDTLSAVGMPDQRYYPPMKYALNDNNVAVYSVDLTPTGWESNQQHFLSNLSVDTGGHYYGTFTNFIVPLRDIADEANGYYLLSYQAEHPAGESGYRQVTVEAKNREFEVKARRGYRYGG